MRVLYLCAVVFVAVSCSTTQNPLTAESRSSSAASTSSTSSIEIAGSTTSSSENVATPEVEETATSQPATNPSGEAEPLQADTSRSCERLPESEEQPWVVVNDGVMGGRSQGVVTTEAGQMQFTGTIVTDGGGFSSVRRLLDSGLNMSDGLQMRVRTDGREYEVLLTDIESQAYRVTYYAPVVTENDGWQVVGVSFDDLEARIFGQQVDAPPFQPEKVTTIGIILADGADGEFLFELDWISACPSTLS